MHAHTHTQPHPSHVSGAHLWQHKALRSCQCSVDQTPPQMRCSPLTGRLGIGFIPCLYPSVCRGTHRERSCAGAVRAPHPCPPTISACGQLALSHGPADWVIVLPAFLTVKINASVPVLSGHHFVNSSLSKDSHVGPEKEQGAMGRLASLCGKGQAVL